MKTSPLNQKHLDLNAKMADFGGWLMPIEYPGAGVLAEHSAVRERVVPGREHALRRGLLDGVQLARELLAWRAGACGGYRGCRADAILNSLPLASLRWHPRGTRAHAVYMPNTCITAYTRACANKLKHIHVGIAVCVCVCVCVCVRACVCAGFQLGNREAAQRRRGLPPAP